MIVACFDLTDGWTFDGEPSTEFGIRFSHGNADRLYPDGLAFGYTVKVGTKNVDTAQWPPSNVTVRELTPNRIFHYRIDAQPDAKVTLKVWATESGKIVNGEHKFTIPRPAQPYPSWEWQNGGWTPPVPYPDGDALHVWDETTQDWTLHEVD